MARPTKYTEDTINGICKWIMGGNSYVDACTMAGISYQTFNEWRHEKSEFSDAIKKAEAKCKAARISRILDASEEKWQAAAWWLERRYPDEYALRKIEKNQPVSKAPDGVRDLARAMLPMEQEERKELLSDLVDSNKVQLV
ncbi:MAG: hypothetical protein ABIA92_02300 [Patescibacteria group bacterium]